MSVGEGVVGAVVGGLVVFIDEIIVELVVGLFFLFAHGLYLSQQGRRGSETKGVKGVLFVWG